MALTRTGASPMPVPGRLRAAQPLASSCQSFISYGGSAVFADMIATGLLQSVPAAATAPSINRLPGF